MLLILLKKAEAEMSINTTAHQTDAKEITFCLVNMDQIGKTVANHPNRSKKRSAYSNPLPGQIAAYRGSLSQSEAAALVYSTASKWQKWEVGEDRMHPGLWELFLIKLEKKTTLEILNRLLEQANEVEASTGFAPLANEALTWAIGEITPHQKTSSD